MNNYVFLFELGLIGLYIISFSIGFIVLAVRTIHRIYQTIECHKRFHCPVRDCILPNHCQGKLLHTKEKQEELRKAIDELADYCASLEDH